MSFSLVKKNLNFSYGSIVTNKSSASTAIFRVTLMDFTVPVNGADTFVSIFMALNTTKGSPLCTKSPSFTRIFTTLPGIGAPTDPRTPFSAFGLRTTF